MVRFDNLGRNLITGITNFPKPPLIEEPESSSRRDILPIPPVSLARGSSDALRSRIVRQMASNQLPSAPRLLPPPNPTGLRISAFRESVMDVARRAAAVAAESRFARRAPRMRCLTDMGIEPVLSVWPTWDTGRLTMTRSFGSLAESPPQPSSSQAGPSRAQAGGPTDASNSAEPHINFPLYGNLMHGRPQRTNNEVGVVGYLTVRQLRDRVNSRRLERDLLRAPTRMPQFPPEHPIERHSGEPLGTYQRRVYRRYVNDLNDWDRELHAQRRRGHQLGLSSEQPESSINTIPTETSQPAEALSDVSNPGSNGGDSSSRAWTRRVIRQPATSEILRSHSDSLQAQPAAAERIPPLSRQFGGNYPTNRHNSNARWIESRVEGILNERGSRGMGTRPPSQYSPAEVTLNPRPLASSNQSAMGARPDINSRLRDTRLMIIGVPEPGPIPDLDSTEAGGSGRPLLSPIRPYSRISLNGDTAGDEAASDEEVPNRIPRVQTLVSGLAVPTIAPTTRTLSAAEPRRRPAPGGSSGPGPGPNERRVDDELIIIRHERGGDPYLEGAATEQRLRSLSTLGQTRSSSARARPEGSGAAGPSNASTAQPDPNPPPMRTNSVGEMGTMSEAEARFLIPNPQVRPPPHYSMETTAPITAFLYSRIQKWDFSQFKIPDISKREACLVINRCCLHNDACLDVSKESEFLAVLQASENGSYSAVGIYSLRDESLGDIICLYKFDCTTVSVSISPSSEYIVVGYAGRGPHYQFVNTSHNVGQILSLARDGDRLKFVKVRDLWADSQSSRIRLKFISWVPVAGYGIVYGTNTGELVLLT